VLPLAEINSRLFGHNLGRCRSAPMAAFWPTTTPPIARSTKPPRHSPTQLKVGALEYRNQAAQHAHWPTKDLYVTFKKAIEPEIEANMNAIPRKQRAMVRKGIKAGLTGEIDADTTRFFRPIRRACIGSARRFSRANSSAC
jgi:hypothetical protein